MRCEGSPQRDHTLVHGGDVDGLGLVDVRLISEDAHLHLGAGNVGQQKSAAETLVTLGIVVLERELEIHGLDELALQRRSGRTPGQAQDTYRVLLGTLQNCGNSLMISIAADLASHPASCAGT
jgi:hypothetical protein